MTLNGPPCRGGLPCGAQLAMIEGPLNKAKPFTVRIEFPANCKIPPHYNQRSSTSAVMSGTGFGIGVGDTHDPAKGTTLPVGSVVIMQPQAHHYGWTTSEEAVVQLYGAGHGPLPTSIRRTIRRKNRLNASKDCS